MIYLKEFTFPTRESESGFFMSLQRTCYDSYYPFGILSKSNLNRLVFEGITILYGGNGSGKTTALNIIAEKLQLSRDSIFNKSNFLADYLSLCHTETCHSIPAGSRIITSDDVFDYMLNIRSINGGIDQKREDLFDEYLDMKYSSFQMSSLEDYEHLKKVNLSRSKTQSKYVRQNLMNNVRERSNGENAFRYFTERLTDDNLYLLDEPENSLSPERQLELVEFLENSARFFGCQFILSTHSPFFLAMKGAKIYDLDENPVCTKPWTDLKNIRVYYEFFQAHGDAF